MLMISAYLDETGSSKDERQRFNGMAGLLAPTRRWQRMERKWNKTLARFRLPYFHMKDFANFRGHYKGWKESKRRDLYGRLLAHIAGAQPFPVGSVMLMRDYREWNQELSKPIFADPYHVGFMQVICYLSCAMELGTPPGNKAALIFSDQVQFRHQALLDYEKLVTLKGIDPTVRERTESPVFRDMKCLVQLQAADIVAYELYKEFERQIDRPHMEPRHGYKVLCEIAKARKLTAPMFAFHTKESLSGKGEIPWAVDLKAGTTNETKIRIPEV